MDDDIVWAMTVLEEDKAASFGYFKRELEAVLGRTLEPIEAQTFYEMAAKELA
jgi:hypothetical protein